MITNRPQLLEANIPHYKNFPQGLNLDVDYKCLPELLNFDFHTLNGILPMTKSRFDFIGQNGTVNGKETTVIFVNPHPEEYEYYYKIGVTEFQAIQIIVNFFAFELVEDGSLKGKPYSVSIVPMEAKGKIDTWNIELMKQFDLEELCQKGGEVFTEFDPFKGWYNGLGMDYPLFSRMGYSGYSDSIGFLWGMYFLSPVFDKKEIVLSQNSSFSPQVNSKYKRLKTELYFKPFTNTNPRRIWGCESPIELFLVQGLYLRGLYPDIQTCFFRNGEIIPNYYKMQKSGMWIAQDNLITSADFYFPNNKLAIFCDGSKFHNADRDKKIDSALAKLGVVSLRYSGKQITEELESVLDDVEKKINGK